LTEVTRGVDPALERQVANARLEEELEARRRAEAARSARIRMGDLVERFIADQQRRRVRSWRENQRSLTRELARLSGQAAADVTAVELDAILARVEDRGAPTEAARLYGRLSTLFAFAVDKGFVAPEASPLLRLAKRTATNARSRVLTPAELRTFLQVLPRAAMTEPVRNILRLQLLLGVRVSEAAGAQRHEIDLAGGFWTIPAGRVKNGVEHTLPLPPEARHILIEAMRRSPHKRLAFPNKAGDGPLEGTVVAKALARSQELFGFKDGLGEPNPFTTHDLRRTCASGLEALGFTEKVIASILNHKSRKERTVTGRHYALADLTDAMHAALIRWQWAIGEILAERDPFAVDTKARRAREVEMLGRHETLGLGDNNVAIH
jgi:integrase